MQAQESESSDTEAQTEVLITGLRDEEPGDVVGAFTNEADVDPEAIGEISIDDAEATVEVDEDNVDRVVDEIDRVGRSEVTVRRLNDETEAVREYVDSYSGLVEVERKEEMRRHENEIRSMSRHEREAKGRALVGMSGRDEGEGIGGYEVKFVKKRGESLPDTEIGVGDLVMVSKNDPLRDDNPTGTVTQVTNHSVTASFDSKPPGFVFGDGLRVDLYVNDVTYQRMLDALDELLEAESESESPERDFSQLRDVIVGTENPSESEPEKADFDTRSPDSDSGSNWHNDSLNESQMSAESRGISRGERRGSSRLCRRQRSRGSRYTEGEYLRKRRERSRKRGNRDRSVSRRYTRRRVRRRCLGRG